MGLPKRLQKILADRNVSQEALQAEVNRIAEAGGMTPDLLSKMDSALKTTRKNKYKNKICFLDGFKFASIHERNYYIYLRDQKARGMIKDFQVKPGFSFIINGHKICDFYPDFEITYLNGETEIHDTKCKPTRTDVYRLKKKLLKAIYGFNLTEVYADKKRGGFRWVRDFKKRKGSNGKEN